MRRISFAISALMLVGCAASAPAGQSALADSNDGENPADPPMLAVMTIPQAVAALESPEILPAGGMDDAYAADGATALDMIKAYIDGKYTKDPENGDSFTFVENAPAFDVDAQVAGTMATDVAIAQVVAALANNDLTHDANVTVGRADEVKGLLQSIAAAGGSFGFDGFGENGCAAPTAFLLVVDPDGKTVYGVDLNPCTK